MVAASPAGVAISAAVVLQETGKPGSPKERGDGMRGRKAADFFTDQEVNAIKAAVSRAESGTAGEIVPMVVDRSDSYREADILGSALTAALLALSIEAVFQLYLLGASGPEWTQGGAETVLALHGISVWTYIPLVFILFFPVRQVFRSFDRLRLLFAGRRRIAEAVRERAVRAFFEKELYRTKDETGVLIFISLLEHKVWILGDRGINAKIPQNSWQALAGELSRGLREGRACEALCSVIDSCGAELARHFPRTTDDIDELKNDLIR
jgi:putative membrane protein